MNTIKGFALAVAASLLPAPSAIATGFAFINGDLLLGFRQSGNNTSDYVIDLSRISSNWTVY